MDHVDVRTASFDDLEPRTAYLLWQLREAVFVVEQACAYQELDGRDLEPSTVHVWIEHDAAPVAYLRILDEAGGEARIGRVLVAEPVRRHGYAGLLMRRALEEIADRPSRLDAQTYLARWYARFGYEISGPEFDEDGIPHVPMRRPAQRFGMLR